MKDVQNIKEAKELNFMDYLSVLDSNPTYFVVLHSLSFLKNLRLQWKIKIR
jgi:hypothetical protein